MSGITSGAPSDSIRQRLYEIMSADELSLEDKQIKTLALGREFLDVQNGHIERADEAAGIHEVVASVGGPATLFTPGETLNRATTYCRRTMEADSPVALTNAPEEGWANDPAYEENELACYLGAPIFVRGEPYGTVCFVDENPRADSFEASEKAFVELIARLLGRELAATSYETELTDAHKRRSTLVKAAPDAIFLVDADTAEVTDVNEAAIALTGYDGADLEGMTVFDLHPTPSRDQYHHLFEDLTTAGETTSTLPDGSQLELQTADGDRIPIEMSARTVELSDGRYVQGIVRDISERVQREQELRLRTRAMDEAGVGISIADATEPDTPLVYVNDAFTDITGYDRRAALGTNCRFLQGAETSEAAVDVIRDAIEYEETRTSELLNYRADGTPFWNELTVTPVADSTGETSHFIGVQRDVTSRKRRERLIGVLNRVLRHNLRNDMTVVTGLSDTIATTADGEIAAHAATVTETARDLISVSEKAKTVETALRDDPAPRPLDIAEVIEETVAELQEAHPEATIRCELPDEQQAIATDRLGMVIEELVDNAIAAGGLRVTVAAVPPDDDEERVTVEVRDDGAGLPAMEARVLKEASESPVDHASSFGLWLVNWLVTEMGGEVAVDVEDGTTVTIALQGGDRDAVARGGAVTEAALGDDPDSWDW